MIARFVDAKNIRDITKELKSIECDEKSIDIMAPKGVFRIIKIEDVKARDAIIIKQDMLSIGGEVAIPRNVFDLENSKNVSILIMGTLKHLKELTLKLDRHYKSIREISNMIKELIKRELSD